MIKLLWKFPNKKEKTNMFRKLVSNIAFSPSLVSELKPYAVGVNKELIVRRVSLLCMSVALIIHLLVLLIPAKPTLTASGNDIIFGGADKTPSGIIASFTANTDSQGRTDIAPIFSHYGLSEENIKEYRLEELRPNNEGDYVITGRLARGIDTEITQTVTNGPLLYLRPLESVQAQTRSLEAMRVETSQGTRWILLENGNILFNRTSPAPTKASISGDALCISSSNAINSSNCLERSVKVRNITSQINDANNSSAKPGDAIEYTLSVQNKSQNTIEKQVLTENVDDVLEYSDIIDASSAIYQEKPVKSLTWQPIDISPNQTVSRTILVKVKSTLPSTPASTSDPLAFDQKLALANGNTVVVTLPVRATKAIEQTIAQLPIVITPLSFGITFFLFVLTLYFYQRARIIAQELDVLLQEFL